LDKAWTSWWRRMHCFGTWAIRRLRARLPTVSWCMLVFHPSSKKSWREPPWPAGLWGRRHFCRNCKKERRGE